MTRLKLGLIAVLVAVGSLLAVGLPAASANAGKDSACQGLGQFSSEQACGSSGDSSVYHAINVGVNLLSMVAGIIIVVTLIYAGALYVTSAGDANKLSRARSALIYSMIGVAVVALAQFLVNFVIKSV